MANICFINVYEPESAFSKDLIRKVNEIQADAPGEMTEEFLDKSLKTIEEIEKNYGEEFIHHSEIKRKDKSYYSFQKSSSGFSPTLETYSHEIPVKWASMFSPKEIEREFTVYDMVSDDLLGEDISNEDIIKYPEKYSIVRDFSLITYTTERDTAIERLKKKIKEYAELQQAIDKKEIKLAKSYESFSKEMQSTVEWLENFQEDSLVVLDLDELILLKSEEELIHGNVIGDFMENERLRKEEILK